MKRIFLPIIASLLIFTHIALAEQNITEKGMVVGNIAITKEGISVPGVNITKEGIEAPGVVIAPGMIVAPGIKITENGTPLVEINKSEIRASESQIVIETGQKSFSAISIEVNVNGKNISINKEGNKVRIKEGDTEVETDETIKVQTGNVSVLTDNGSVVIRITPDELTAKKELINQTIQKIELKTEENKVLYQVKGVKSARLLFLMPVSINMQTDIDAVSGKVEKIKSPWWSVLAS